MRAAGYGHIDVKHHIVCDTIEQWKAHVMYAETQERHADF